MTDTSNPWRIVESRQAYDNPWIRVVEHDVINPAGNPGIYGLIHFKNIAVGVVPYHEGRIWMVGQYRIAVDSYSWEIPEGGGPYGEDPLMTAQRELKEETGMTAAHYEKLIEFDNSNSVSDERAVIYLATGLDHGESAPEDVEVLAVKSMTLDEAYALVEQHEIRDAMTVAAIYKMMLLRATGCLP